MTRNATYVTTAEQFRSLWMRAVVLLSSIALLLPAFLLVFFVLEAL